LKNLLETPKNSCVSRSISYGSYVFLDKVLKLGSISKLNERSQSALKIQNAGGQSEVSEAYSIQYFIEYFHAKNILLEMEVEYWIQYKMVDFVCTINEERVGVSVTRAMGFPNPQCFTFSDAKRLLHKKLYGLIVSRNGVTEKHSFFKSILHIWCQTKEIANFLTLAWSEFDINDFDLDVKGTVVVILTICENQRLYLNNYFEEKMRKFFKLLT